MVDSNDTTRSTDDALTREFPRLTAPLRPLVDLVARLQVGVNVKLLSGFLVGASLSGKTEELANLAAQAAETTKP